MKIIPVRALVAFGAFLVIYVGAQILIQVLVFKLRSQISPVLITGAVVLLAVPAIILAYRAFVRRFEGRNADELGLRGIFQLIPGALLGLGIFSAIFGGLWLVGVAHVSGFNHDPALGTALALAVFSGVFEEIIFRGALFRILEEGWGTLIALAISSAVFGALHLLNHNATLVGGAAIAIEAGTLTGAAYVLTRSLWLPIGLHFAWNFAEGGIFSTPVSGNSSHGLIADTLSGPALLTGGIFGPEASIEAMVVGAMAAIIILLIAAARGQWRPIQQRWRFA